MKDLIEKLAQAEGPSRELDIAIKAAVYGGVALVSPFNGEWCVYRPGTTDPRVGRVLECPRNVSGDAWRNDRYTASIDAALTLAPEGSTGIISIESGYARIERSDGMHWSGDAVTPAIALCIAALSAKEPSQ